MKKERTMALCTLILAAGASKRMRGHDKLLEEINGTPLLRRMTCAALKATQSVIVTLPHQNHERAKAVSDLNVSIVSVLNSTLGLSSSIKAGVAALPENASAVMIVPGDMPELTADDLITMAIAYSDKQTKILRAASGSKAGHPVVFPKRYFGSQLKLSGDQGAKSLLKQDDVRIVPLPENHATLDLDTPEEWREWRNQQLAR